MPDMWPESRNKFQFLLLVFLIGTGTANAQTKITPEYLNPFHARITLDSLSTGTVSVSTGTFAFTALLIESPVETGVRVRVHSMNVSETRKWVKHTGICHEGYPEKDGFLLVWPAPQKSLSLSSEGCKSRLTLHLFYAPALPVSSPQTLHKQTHRCDKPAMIGYSSWRAGLPDPRPPRETTKVQHLVIHHSAGSNTDTHYVDMVRNIYLLHTQSNGWDDIGYNYIIAPDGTVFAGRDPQGAGSDDNILGAHFCGKNANTLGICILGNYQLIQPDKRALFSLKYLLAWKSAKDHIDPFGRSAHPQPNGNLLDHLCGHRDGCSTSCPGDSLYPYINGLKNEVQRLVDSCNRAAEIVSPYPGNVPRILTNPGSETLRLFIPSPNESCMLKIYNAYGQVLFNGKYFSGEIFTLFLPEGYYCYTLEDHQRKQYKGKLIIKY